MSRPSKMTDEYHCRTPFQWLHPNAPARSPTTYQSLVTCHLVRYLVFPCKPKALRACIGSWHVVVSYRSCPFSALSSLASVNLRQLSIANQPTSSTAQDCQTPSRRTVASRLLPALPALPALQYLHNSVGSTTKAGMHHVACRILTTWIQ